VGIVLSVPLYLAVRARRAVPALPAAARYVGTERCRACHPAAFEKWKGSHHGLAMQPARVGTVLGDFNEASFELRGESWRFFRRGEKYRVSAEGPDGALHDYEVAYAFGVNPLQQYLVPFPGGRLQCLSVAWDTRARRWFFLYPGQDVPPSDWLHWTRPAQNWNTMCADCHSTAVRKRYEPASDTFQTTWSEISVGCEACHGPGSLHVSWADQPALARPPVENKALLTRTTRLSSREQVELCAPCHTRRAQFADQGLPGGEPLERYLPVLLSPGLFFADGQVLDEDYETHAFVQSKMYANGIKCSDCHDVHAGTRYKEGNALCTRCHRADAYDAPEHHFHSPTWQGKPSGAVLCTSCHMPGRDYMVVHFRRDHSFRVPRPDLSAAVGSPNACSARGCHADKPAAWLASNYEIWYGRKRKPHYGTALAAGRERSPEAEGELVRLAQDQLRPAIARATALELLGGYDGEESAKALARALTEPEALLRRTAASRLRRSDPTLLIKDLAPLLKDPVRAVRIEAAARLSEVPAQLLGEPQRQAYGMALDEYVESQRFMSDMPSGRYNLGNLYSNQGRSAEAEAQYRRALAIDERFFLAKVNLAMLLAQQRRGDEAERLLREAHLAQPRAAAVAFNLGLLLAERGKPEEAEQALRAALSVDPRHAAAAYDLAVLVGAKRPAEAAALSRRAAELRPDEPNYAWSLSFYQAQASDLAGAAATLEALLRRHPNHADSWRLLGELYERLGRRADAVALYRQAQGTMALPAEARTALGRRAHALEINGAP
jgi:Tfp pilus assembly protein PilF